MDTRATPTDVSISRKQGLCTLTWSDGRVSSLTLADLRRLCPCATCNEQRANQANSLMVISGPVPSAELEAAEPVGGYAIRFRWADGHDSGIYSYQYLRQLAENTS